MKRVADMFAAAPQRPLRKSLTTVLAGLLVVGAVGAARAAPAADAPRSVQDLRYGVVLYDFFQDDFFQALTELLLGEQMQDMPHHAEFAALLRGGISLSYGMDEQARGIFNQLLAQHPSAAVRDRAWFYLGKSYYQRGDYATAADLLARSGAALPIEFAQERDYLQSIISLKHGNIRVVSVAADLEMNPWLPYLLFNSGVAQASVGDTASAAVTLTRLAQLPLTEPEHKALRDRAFTAAGYNFLNAKDPEQAIGVLSKVRLNSPLADKALLGYGWAFAQRRDFAGALQSWQTLTQRSMLLPSVQEALLAIPYAYEQLNAPAQALEEYARAEQLLLREMQRIDSAQKTLQSASLLSLWVDVTDSPQWLARRQELPVNPQLPYLEHLLARNDIQEIIRDLRDLHLLETHLGDWIGRLDALYTAQALQYQRRQQLLQHRPDQVMLQQYHLLVERQAALAQQADDAIARGDGAPLMDAKEVAAMQRLDRMRTNIEALRAAGKNMDEESRKYERLRGVLLWQMQDQFPARRRETTRQLRELAAALAETQRYQARVATLVERASQPEQSERIHALLQRLEAQLVNIRSAQGDGELLLRRLAVDEMEQQRQRLQLSLARARLAMARLYDKGATESDAPAARVPVQDGAEVAP